MQLTGFHHVTAITADAPGNLAFYTQVLGMRLVKKTVNQDDVSAYHLFYADGRGTPGTDLTFFDWPAVPERRGTNSVVRTGFRLASEASLAWWADRLEKSDIRHASIAQRDGRSILAFEDREGQRLSFVHDEAETESIPWEKSPVPSEHQIRGLGAVQLRVARMERIEPLLTEVLNMRKVREYVIEDSQTVHVFTMEGNGTAAELHVQVWPAPMARAGAGGVHHVAFRVPSAEQHQAWIARVTEAGIANSGLIDRFYFRSLYFREPNGILFELATDGPGFAADESPDTLGERLSLPPFLEPRRSQIEAGLKPL